MGILSLKLINPLLSLFAKILAFIFVENIAMSKLKIIPAFFYHISMHSV